MNAKKTIAVSEDCSLCTREQKPLHSVCNDCLPLIPDFNDPETVLASGCQYCSEFGKKYNLNGIEYFLCKYHIMAKIEDKRLIIMMP